jgi:hypothetical protein
MGASQVAVIRSVLEELYAGFQQDVDLCASFETCSGDIWIQIVRDALNMVWPFDEVEAAKLESVLASKWPHCRILSIEAGKFMTFEIELISTGDMAGWIDWLFTNIFKVSRDYVLNSEIYQL